MKLVKIMTCDVPKGNNLGTFKNRICNNVKTPKSIFCGVFLQGGWNYKVSCKINICIFLKPPCNDIHVQLNLDFEMTSSLLFIPLP